MHFTELHELEASNDSYDEQSLITISLLSARRKEFPKWHRAGRARLAYIMQMHRQTCNVCRCND
jgi:hypothetical protein